MNAFHSYNVLTGKKGQNKTANSKNRVGCFGQTGMKIVYGLVVVEVAVAVAVAVAAPVVAVAPAPTTITTNISSPKNSPLAFDMRQFPRTVPAVAGAVMETEIS